MADITASMVKELRERTGAGMMECKNALVQANGNMAEAEDIIAKTSQNKAAKKASRTAAEGRIVIASNPQAIALIEINCETDFVAKDESFVQFCQQVVNIALQQHIQDVTALLDVKIDASNTVEDARKALIARLGENIQIRRLVALNAQSNQLIGSYVHNNRIGAVVLVEGGNPQVAKDIAMHVAAMKPEFVTSQEVPQAIIDKEKEILDERAKTSGKPANILEKIVAGQLQKYLNEICLTGQAFFKDQDQTIAQVLKSADAKVLKMIRLEVGEGIEVVKKSFEEEVMSAARGNS